MAHESAAVQDDGPSDGYHTAETEHIENTGSGILRASVFGISDGLVSNLALVMGVAGGTHDAQAIVMAGSAGLLAGAFSMAVGEYISMQTQREAMEQQLQVEREHILRFPEEEEAHLKELLLQSGLAEEVARDMARRIHEDIDPAVDFHALLELGIVPSQMGSPVAAALSSFVSFVAGALIPLLPWIFSSRALVPSLAASTLALLLIGGLLTQITHRSPIGGALRQLLLGGAAAGVTYALGNIIGSAL